METKFDLITILGPTACGKTQLATQLASRIKAEIISGDSRQVYRSMDIGTGKDLNEYVVNGQPIPHHLIDIVPPGYKYSIYEYQHDFLNAYNTIKRHNSFPILCGGSGLYVESVLRGYRLMPVPVNEPLRKSLEGKSLNELTQILSSYKKLHNTTDTDTIKRAIRGIEIEEYYQSIPIERNNFPHFRSLNIGLSISREQRWKKIHDRLIQRVENGLVEEIEKLLQSGVLPEELIYYGLEYKFVTLYITGRLSYDDMLSQLETAIRQFSKRQMTWFRGMERRGVHIFWIDASWSMEEKLSQIEYIMQEAHKKDVL